MDLHQARREGWLWLYDTEARFGEFDELEKTCRRLGLSYERHSEAGYGYDAQVVDWRPNMEQPLSRPCSNEHGDVTVVASDHVKKAIQWLEADQVQQAISLLRGLCPEIPELPCFEIL